MSFFNSNILGDRVPSLTALCHNWLVCHANNIEDETTDPIQKRINHWPEELKERVGGYEYIISRSLNSLGNSLINNVPFQPLHALSLEKKIKLLNSISLLEEWNLLGPTLKTQWIQLHKELERTKTDEGKKFKLDAYLQALLTRVIETPCSSSLFFDLRNLFYSCERLRNNIHASHPLNEKLFIQACANGKREIAHCLFSLLSLNLQYRKLNENLEKLVTLGLKEAIQNGQLQDIFPIIQTKELVQNFSLLDKLLQFAIKKGEMSSAAFLSAQMTQSFEPMKMQTQELMAEESCLDAFFSSEKGNLSELITHLEKLILKENKQLSLQDKEQIFVFFVNSVEWKTFEPTSGIAWIRLKKALSERPINIIQTEHLVSHFIFKCLETAARSSAPTSFRLFLILLTGEPSHDVSRLNPALKSACRLGERSMIQSYLELIKLEKLSFSHSKKRNTPIHWATRGGHLDIVQDLVKADPDAVFAEGNLDRTAVHIASKEGDLNILKFLVDNKGNIDADALRINSCGFPIEFAYASAQGEVIGFLEEKNAESMSSKKFFLQRLAREGSLELFVQQLQKMQWDINTQFKNKKTILDEAIAYGQKEIVKHLLKQDAILSTGLKVSSFVRAATQKNPEILPILFDHVGDQISLYAEDLKRALTQAISGKHIKNIAFLLEKGISCQIPTDSLLCVLEEHLCFPEVKELMKFGMNLNAQDNEKRTALHYSAMRMEEHDEIYSAVLTAFLLTRGADAAIRDKDDKTALQYAAKLGKKITVELLLAAGADEYDLPIEFIRDQVAAEKAKNLLERFNLKTAVFRFKEK